MCFCLKIYCWLNRTQSRICMSLDITATEYKEAVNNNRVLAFTCPVCRANQPPAHEELMEVDKESRDIRGDDQPPQEEFVYYQFICIICNRPIV